MRALKASLVKHGLVLNLVVQKQGLVLIGGHQRVTAMREVCAERGVEMPAQAWATVLDVDDATAKQLNVGLNNIEGEFDHYKLGLMFAEMLPSMTTDDVLATGFEQENIEQMIALRQQHTDMRPLAGGGGRGPRRVCSQRRLLSGAPRRWSSEASLGGPARARRGPSKKSRRCAPRRAQEPEPCPKAARTAASTLQACK